MFIACPESIKNCATDISPSFWRIQAVKFKFGNSIILLINSYFPTDTRRADNHDSELDETLGHIRNVIRNNDFDSLLWAGDINAEFLRATSHTRTVHAAVDDLGLTKAWDRFNIDFTHCHEQLGIIHTSILSEMQGFFIFQIISLITFQYTVLLELKESSKKFQVQNQESQDHHGREQVRKRKQTSKHC